MAANPRTQTPADHMRRVHHMIETAGPAEVALLGLVLQDGRRFIDAAASVRPEDFQLLRHMTIFQAMAELQDEGLTPDFVGVQTKLAARGGTDFEEQSLYLAELLSRAWGDIDDHARTIQWSALRNRLRAAGEEIVTLATTTDNLDPELLYSKAVNLIMETDRGDITADDPIDLFQLYFDTANKIRSTVGLTGVSGLMTGFKAYDLITDGFQEASVNIFGGRPGMGKTSAATAVATEMAKRGKRVYYWTGEQSQYELAQKFFSSLTGISSIKLRRGWRPGGLDSHDWEEFVKLQKSINEYGIFVDVKKPMTVLGLASRVQKVKRRFGVDLIVVDYVQLLDPIGNFGGNRAAAVAQISGHVKQVLAGIAPVILVAQLNRATEGRQDKRPTLADLKESGNLEQDADTVTFFFREEYYDKDAQNGDLTEWIVAKNRHGRTSKTPNEASYIFLPEQNRFAGVMWDGRP